MLLVLASTVSTHWDANMLLINWQVLNSILYLQRVCQHAVNVLLSHFEAVCNSFGCICSISILDRGNVIV